MDASPSDELTIGSLHFEYDAQTHYLGIGNEEELYGTAEVAPDVWEAFYEAAKTLDIQEGEVLVPLLTEEAKALSLASIFGDPDQGHPALEAGRAKLRAAVGEPDTLPLPFPCSCSDVRGCPNCFDKAEHYVGRRVRDDKGREWAVEETDEKDGFPVVAGEHHWAGLEDVELVDRVFPMKLDEDRINAVGPLGESMTFDDFLDIGDEVGIGPIPEDAEDRDPRPPFGVVERRPDGLWLRAYTEKEETERTRRIIDKAQEGGDG